MAAQHRAAQSRVSRNQVFESDHSKFCLGKHDRPRTFHLVTVGTKHIDSYRSYGINCLQHRFAGRIMRMDMARQQNISKALGQAIKAGRNKVQVMKGPYESRRTSFF
jgi:hypothetical protein